MIIRNLLLPYEIVTEKLSYLEKFETVAYSLLSCHYVVHNRLRCGATMH